MSDRDTCEFRDCAVCHGAGCSTEARPPITIEAAAAAHAVVALSEIRGWAVGASEGGYRWMLDRVDAALDAFGVTEEVRRATGDVLEGRHLLDAVRVDAPEADDD